jgi:hypothetical protein
MSAKSSALVFASNETFAPLAKGLVLSVLEQMNPGEFALNLVDIGCSERTRAWMRQLGVSISRFDRSLYLRAPMYPLDLLVKPYQDAQLCRPFLPQMFPGFPIYLWSDTDLWVQDIESLRLYRDLAAERKAMVPVSPLIDASYEFYYHDATEFVGYANTWYGDAYGASRAVIYSKRVIFSSGLFAMHCHNPIWSEWAGELNAILGRPFSSQASLHVAEQTALNYLLYAHENFIPLEATHNYNCHIGRLKRAKSGVVHIDIPPFRKVGVIHLTYSSKMMGKYIDNGLLYEKGSYLSSAEIDQLRRLSHY